MRAGKTKATKAVAVQFVEMHLEICTLPPGKLTAKQKILRLVSAGEVLRRLFN